MPVQELIPPLLSSFALFLSIILLALIVALKGKTALVSLMHPRDIATIFLAGALILVMLGLHEFLELMPIVRGFPDALLSLLLAVMVVRACMAIAFLAKHRRG